MFYYSWKITPDLQFINTTTEYSVSHFNKKVFQLKVNHSLANRLWARWVSHVNKFEQVHVVGDWPMALNIKQNDRQTLLKTLPSLKLRLWAVKFKKLQKYWKSKHTYPLFSLHLCDERKRKSLSADLSITSPRDRNGWSSCKLGPFKSMIKTQLWKGTEKL